MSTVRDLHDDAMKLAQESILEREVGTPQRAAELAKQALQLEVEAARQIDVSTSNEPTRSILFKSAASLALQAREYDFAERLVAEGLLGSPPGNVRAELASVYEQVRFERNLESKKLVLLGDQVSLTIKGLSVGFGQVVYKDFKKRVDALITLLDRTSRRMQKQPYQSRGPVPKSIQKFQPVLGTPRAGSFAVTIEMALIQDTNNSLFTDQSQVIESVISGVQLLENGNEEQLRERIPEDAYYTNFLTMARELAPDGESVSRVSIESRASSVDFTRIETQFSSPAVVYEPDSSDSKIEELTGTLISADARKDEMIGLETESGFFQLIVPEGLDDLVRTYFRMEVTTIVAVEGNVRTLQNLREIEA